MKIKPLVRGICPICAKIIMTPDKTKYINGGMSFWVLFSDNTKAEFAICEECYRALTQEQLGGIMSSQIVNWGQEIDAQLQWYYKNAVHLKIIKHSKDKNAITSPT